MSLSSLLNHTKKSVSGILKNVENCLYTFLLTYGKTLFDKFNYSMFKLNATCTNI